MMIAKIIGPILLVVGLSMLLYIGSWQKVISEFEKNHFGVLPFAALDMAGGLIIINMYSVWTWNIWIIVTIVGWLLFVKSVLYFLTPGSTTKEVLKFWNNKTVIMVDGLVMTAAGAALSYYSYMV